MKYLILSIFRSLFPSKIERKYFNHLKKYGISKKETSSKVLIEFNPVYSNIIGLSYFLKVFRSKSQAQFIAYLIYPQKIWHPFLYSFKMKLYKAMGVNKWIYLLGTVPQDEIENFYNIIWPTINSKSDFDWMKFENIIVGDLIYDSYMQKYKQPTIDIESDFLKKEVLLAIEYYLSAKKQLTQNKIEAVIVSHTVYSHFAIMSRLATSYGIPTYQVNDAALYYLSGNETHAYVEFKSFHKEFSLLNQSNQTKILSWAEERLNKKFSGVVGVDMGYSTKSAWSEPSEDQNIFSNNNKTKILLALHCFFDSPHPYGHNLFPDFYEWLHFLGKLSEETDYEWYLKTHPDFIKENIPIVEEIVAKFPKFKLIPSTTSHHLIRKHVQFVFTTYGTIGGEYPFYGIPVVNASLNNPHINYNFNIHPKSLSDYRNIILNLPQQKLEIKKEEMYEFYGMRFHYYGSNWLWNNFEQMIKDIGGISNFDSTKILVEFHDKINSQEDERINEEVLYFLESKKYRNISKPYRNN